MMLKLGCVKGMYMEELFNKWKGAKKVYSIDLWQHQKNYHDDANVADDLHLEYMNEAKNQLKKFEDSGVSLLYIEN